MRASLAVRRPRPRSLQRGAGLLLCAAALHGGAARAQTALVPATVETDPTPSGGDSADDAAIWIHPTDPGQSVVIGTDKDGGIAVYDLAGSELSYRPDGEINNVDLRYGFALGGELVDLVAASNDTTADAPLAPSSPDHVCSLRKRSRSSSSILTTRPARKAGRP